MKLDAPLFHPRQLDPDLLGSVGLEIVVLGIRLGAKAPVDAPIGFSRMLFPLDY